MQVSTLRKITSIGYAVTPVHASSFEAVLTGVGVEIASKVNTPIVLCAILTTTGALICWRAWRKTRHAKRRLLAEARKLNQEIHENIEEREEIESG